MARKQLQQDNFINACSTPSVNLLDKEPEKTGKFGITKSLTINQKLAQAKQKEKDRLVELSLIYQPLFKRLKDEFPLRSYGHGYRCTYRQTS